eukprot:1840538-Pleurochrysis_carterae.AAC.1
MGYCYDSYDMLRRAHAVRKVAAPLKECLFRQYAYMPRVTYLVEDRFNLDFIIAKVNIVEDYLAADSIT